jgi:hypothetical protein
MNKSAVASTLSAILVCGLPNGALADGRVLQSTSGTVRTADAYSRTVVLENGLAFAMSESADLRALQAGAEVCIFCGESGSNCHVIPVQAAGAPVAAADTIAPVWTRSGFAIVGSPEGMDSSAALAAAEPQGRGFQASAPSAAPGRNTRVISESELAGGSAIAAAAPAASLAGGNGITTPDQLRNDPRIVSPAELRNDPSIVSPDELRSDPRIVSPDELRNDPRIVSPNELRNNIGAASPAAASSKVAAASSGAAPGGNPSAAAPAPRNNTGISSPADPPQSNSATPGLAEPATGNTGTASPADPPASNTAAPGLPDSPRNNTGISSPADPPRSN